jgi:hypothetical protein
MGEHIETAKKPERVESVQRLSLSYSIMFLRWRRAITWIGSRHVDHDPASGPLLMLLVPAYQWYL